MEALSAITGESGQVVFLDAMVEANEASFTSTEFVGTPKVSLINGFARFAYTSMMIWLTNLAEIAKKSCGVGFVSSGPRDIDKSGSRSEDEQELADEIQAILKDRANQSMEFQMKPGDGLSSPKDGDRALFGIPGVDCIDDFLKYLLIKKTRQRVIDEFVKVVKPRLEAGEEIELFSHSWGTVVAPRRLAPTR